MFLCQAILFDLDGTLIDSIEAVNRCWTRWALRHGLEPAQVVPRIHGRRAAESIRLFAPIAETELAAEEAWLQDQEASDTDGITLIPGAMAFLDQIPTDRWAIVTSGSLPVATARMGAVGIRPPQFITADDVSVGKPAPDPYLLAATRLGFPPEACLVFEDNAAGIQAGRAAGMAVIAVGHPDRADLAAAAAIIRDFRDLAIDRVEGQILVRFDSRG